MDQQLGRREEDEADEADEDDDDDEEEDWNDDDDVDYELHFDEETLLRLERNDPSLAGLEIDGTYWTERAGRVIGESKILSQLNIIVSVASNDNDNDNESSRRWLDELFSGLAINRNIASITLPRTGEGDYRYQFQYDVTSPVRHSRRLDNFHLLAPFFECNACLRVLEIEEFDLSAILNPLGAALSKCKYSELECLTLGGNIFEDEQAAHFIRSLNGKHELQSLHFYGNTIVNMERGNLCYEIAQLMTNPASNIRELSILDTSNFDDTCLAILGYALRGKTVLESLELDGNYAISTNGWRIFFAVLSSPTCGIWKLSLENTHMDSDGIAYLGESLASNTTLQYIDMRRNPSIDATGWNRFFECLRSPDAALKGIDISRCNINDELAIVIATVLTQKTCLKDLQMAWNGAITLAGWKSFFNIMLHCNSCCSLESLGMMFDRDDGDRWVEELDECLRHRLCDESSIDNIYSSNHTLQAVVTWRNWSSLLRCLFELNKNMDKAVVAREKILDRHFFLGDETTKIQIFDRMPRATLPFSLEWIGRGKSCREFSLLFRCVKEFPVLFEVCNSQDGLRRCDGMRKRKALEG